MTRNSRVAELSALAGEARACGVPVEVLKDISDGATRALLIQFPRASVADLAGPVKLIRADACKMLRETGGTWPSGKSNFYVQAIARLIVSHNDAFAGALVSN